MNLVNIMIEGRLYSLLLAGAIAGWDKKDAMSRLILPETHYQLAFLHVIVF